MQMKNMTISTVSQLKPGFVKTNILWTVVRPAIIGLIGKLKVFYSAMKMDRPFI